MNYADYVALNDYTDEKEYELVIRVFQDGSSFGWYKFAGKTNKQVSDSQFDAGAIDPGNAEEVIAEKFKCYYVEKR